MCCQDARGLSLDGSTTQNDSELIAVWVSDQISSGISPVDALKKSISSIDGVFTYMTALGGAGHSCADALWQGEVWVAGPVDSLGVDVKVVEPTAEEVAEVDAILEPLGLVDSSRNWRKMISGQRLWYFESRDASAWLMI